MYAAPLLDSSAYALLPAMGTPLQYHDALALLQRVTTPQLSPVPGVGYLEAQYHDAVRCKDIDEVFFYGQDPEPDTIRVLDNVGLKWERLW